MAVVMSSQNFCYTANRALRMNFLTPLAPYFYGTIPVNFHQDLSQSIMKTETAEVRLANEAPAHIGLSLRMETVRHLKTQQS